MNLLGRIRALFRRTGRTRGWRPFLVVFWPFILGSTLVAGGLAAIVLAYFGVAGTVFVGLQLPYVVSGGLLGLALVIFGSALILGHALNRQARLLRRLLEETRAARAGEAGAADGPAADGMVVVPKGAASFHRPGCELVESKQVRRMRVDTATKKGLEPCRLCDPIVAPA